MANTHSTPFHLDAERAILTPSSALVIKTLTDTFYQDLDTEFENFAGHTLISQFRFEAPWGVWEMHPMGDELVYLLSGATDLVLREASGDRRITVDQPGQFVVVPKGVWHTAEPHSATHMLFVTPGEGTQNLAQPPD